MADSRRKVKDGVPSKRWERSIVGVVEKKRD